MTLITGSRYGELYQDVGTIALAADDSTDPVVTERKIFPDGLLYLRGKSLPLNLGESFRQGMINQFNTRGHKVPLDFNHATDGWNVSEAEGSAAGWITELHDRGADGLWASIEWTERGLKAVRSKFYKYTSPTFEMSTFVKSTGKRIAEPTLHALALTNRPYLEGQESIAASDAAIGGISMADESDKEEVKKEGEGTGDVEGRLKSLEDSVSSIKGSVDGILKALEGDEDGDTGEEALSEVASLRAQLKDRDDKDRTRAINNAMAEGKVTPATLAGFEKAAIGFSDDLDGFISFLNAQPVIAKTERKSETGTNNDGAISLSDDEMKAAKALNLTPEEYALGMEA